MKKNTITTVISMMLAIMLISTASFSQTDKSKRPSPPANVKAMVAGANIMIDYSSPSVKGRKIFGDLVPYGKFWRGGANEATIFTTDKDIKVGGKNLPKGSYSLFYKPGEKEWTVVFNSETGQWGIKKGGDANFDPAKNVAEVTVNAVKAPKMYEKLAYEINENSFSLIWDNLKVPVSITK